MSKAIFAVFLVLLMGRAGAAVDLNVVYHQQCSDIIAGSWTEFTDTLATEYHGYNIGSDPDTRATEAGSIRGLLDLMKLNSCSASIDVVEVADNSANAIVHFRLEGTVRKPVGRLRTGDHVAFVFHSADTWRKSSGTWLQVSADTLGSRVYLNGIETRHQGLP